MPLIKQTKPIKAIVPEIINSDKSITYHLCEGANITVRITHATPIVPKPKKHTSSTNLFPIFKINILSPLCLNANGDSLCRQRLSRLAMN